MENRREDLHYSDIRSEGYFQRLTGEAVKASVIGFITGVCFTVAQKLLTRGS